MNPEREARRAKRREKTKAWGARVAEATEMARIERRLRSDDDKPSAHQLMRLLPWKAKGQSQMERFELLSQRSLTMRAYQKQILASFSNNIIWGKK